MRIFNDDYQYKIKLIGYALQMKSYEYLKINLYLKSHGEIYNICYINNVNKSSNYLIITSNYDEVEIFQSEHSGISDEEIHPIKTVVNLDEMKKQKIYNIDVIKKLHYKDAEIIATKYFSLDLNNKKLVVYPEEFEQVPSNILLRKLIRE